MFKILNLSIKTVSPSKSLINEGVSSFSSLALFVFNKADGYCEYSELIPVFHQQYVDEYSRYLKISSGTKLIYAIANYNDPYKTFSIPITPNLTIHQLESITVENSRLLDTNVLMIGKKERNINNSYAVTEVLVEKLAARLDVHVFKSIDSESHVMNIKSIEFVNEVLNSNCQYQLPTMLSPTKKSNVILSISENTVLGLMPSDLISIIPQNAHASFYSYQNTASIPSPNEEITSYLKVGVNIDGKDYTFKGYILDNQTNKYNLIRNNIYRIFVVIHKLNKELEVNTSVIPLNNTVTMPEIEYQVKKSNSITDVSNTNVDTIIGTVKYPYTSEGIENTSLCNSYCFNLTTSLMREFDFISDYFGSTSPKSFLFEEIAPENKVKITTHLRKGNNRSESLYVIIKGLKITPVIPIS